MSRPLRDRDPSKVHLITTRTVDAAIWMIPTALVTRTIGGIIARYQEIFSIHVYAFAVLGNHYHLLVKAPQGHLDEFVENINREMARRMNWQHGRKAKFWERRYDDQVVLSDEDAVEALLYIVTNPVKHGLSADLKTYPGLLCYQQILDHTPQKFEFVHYAKSSEEGAIKTTHFLTLYPLPALEKLEAKARRRLLLEQIHARIELLKKERPHYLTPSTLRKQTAGAIPKNVSRSPRPLAYSKDPALIKEHRESTKHLLLCYAEASARYRAGEKEVPFPPHTFKPPLHRAPRVVPFGHLDRVAA